LQLDLNGFNLVPSGAGITLKRRSDAGAGRVSPSVEGRAARFDAKDLRHHHFLRDRCGNVEDIEWYDVPRPASGSFDKRILRECEVIFRGLCAKCVPRHSSR
jgi:Fe2+ or Zn2+ uptake regulation protein